MICVACGGTPVDRAHVKSRGSGGSDESYNVIPMCRACHRSQHTWGWKKMLELKPTLAMHLRKLGWEWEEVFGRFILTHPQMKKGNSNGYEENRQEETQEVSEVKSSSNSILVKESVEAPHVNRGRSQKGDELNVKSKKAKGLRACQEARDLMLLYAPDLGPDDIVVTSSGANGEDLKLSPKARERFPLVVECANTETIQIWKKFRQAEEHLEDFASRNEHSWAVPILFFTKNRAELMVCLKATDFFKLVS